MRHICRLAVLSLILCVSLTKSSTTKDSNSVFRSVPQKDQPTGIKLHVQRQLSVVQGVKDFFSSFIDLFSKVAQFFQRLINDYQFTRIKKAASDAFSQRDYITTVKECTKGLKIQPENNEMLFLRARAYFKLKKYSKTIAECKLKDDFDWKLLLIKSYFYDGQYENVISNCENDADCDIWKVKALCKLDRLEEAIDVLSTVEDDWDHEIDLVIFKDKMYYQTLGLTSQATRSEIEQAYEQLKDQNATREAYQVLSNSRLRDVYDLYLKQQFHNALEEFRRENWSKTISKATQALEILPSSEKMLLLRAEAYFKSVKYDKAITDLDEIPDSNSALKLKAEILLKMGGEERLMEAEKILSKIYISESNDLDEDEGLGSLGWSTRNTLLNNQWATERLQRNVKEELSSIQKIKFQGKRFYETLVLSRSSTRLEIKRAYQRMAKMTHPSRREATTEGIERFKAINEAYQVLSNEDTRRQYHEYMSTLYNRQQYDQVDPGALVESQRRRVMLRRGQRLIQRHEMEKAFKILDEIRNESQDADELCQMMGNYMTNHYHVLGLV